MEYREMKNIGERVSLLGFGCMRFPVKPDGSIHKEQAFAMIDEAYQNGVNYFDTAYPYHGGTSEAVTGEALSRYPRNSYYLATKLPVWLVSSLEDARRIFAEQLGRLKKEYVDFYLMHALNKDRWKQVKELKLLEYFESLKEQGKIRYLGFSFHDDFEVFQEIIKAYPWDFCQIQFNYMDKDTQATDKGIALAESLGIPVVVMEPIKGGSLANLPGDITDMFRESRPDDTASSWALRYVGTFPNVKVILSGMSDMSQVRDNLKTFGKFEPLSDKEQEVVANVAKALHARVQNGCTGCQYCMPCPAGVDIPGSFKIWNTYHVYNNVKDTLSRWNNELKAEAKPINCVECGKCETVCPQKIHIRENLKRVQKEMEAL